MSLTGASRRVRALLGCGFLYAASLTSICAQPVTIDLHPSRTKIAFTLGTVLHTIHGTFKLKSGHLELDPETKAISGRIAVDAASGESGNALRDRRMRRSILETDLYPEIMFTATGMEGELSPTGSSSITVTGWFQIHGQRHQLSVPMEVQVFGAEATAKGHFIVPYVALGMKNPSTFILRVDQQVDIDIAAVVSMVRHRD